jgi:hypothetical protein
MRVRTHLVLAVALVWGAVVSLQMQAIAASGKNIAFIHKCTKNPDYTINLGDLDVQPGEAGKPATLQVVIEPSAQHMKPEVIPVTKLKDFGSPVKDWDYGVSTKNELLLIQGAGPKVKVLVGPNGQVAIRNLESLKDWDGKKLKIIEGQREPDGRIRVGGK